MHIAPTQSLCSHVARARRPGLGFGLGHWSPSPLTVLELSGTGLADHQIAVLAKGLGALKTLEHLSLRYNRIGDQGAKALAAELLTTKFDPFAAASAGGSKSSASISSPGTTMCGVSGV